MAILDVKRTVGAQLDAGSRLVIPPYAYQRRNPAPSGDWGAYSYNPKMAHLGFSFDLRSSPTGSSHTELVSAVLEICEWADGVEGLASSAMLLEHHCSSDGYLPTPILLAAAIAGRTKRMRLAIMVLAPLFHPLRLAEELAMLDLISEGRTSFMLGAGYRAEEFAAFGVRLEDRGALMEQA